METTQGISTHPRRKEIVKLSVLAFVVLFTAQGCACLHMRPTDSTTTWVLKGLARVPVAVLTVGRSEVWHQRERTMESWFGHDESELIMSWGAANSVLPVGQGGRILCYTESRSYVSPGHANTTTTANAYGQVYGRNVYVFGQGQSQTTYIPPQQHHWQVRR